MAKIYTKQTWVDEILAAAERYNVLDNVGTPIHSNVQLDLATTVSVPGTGLTATRLNHIEDGIDALDNKLDPISSRNAIINGGMNIWQRGVGTLTSPAAGTFLADRFAVSYSLSSGTFNTIRSTETPGVGFPFKYSIQIDCTSVTTVVNATDTVSIRYHMEGYDFTRFEGQIATLSFWVKATKVGIYCVQFKNNASDRSYIVEYTINASNTWEKKTITLTFNATGGTAFEHTTSIGLKIYWTILNGSTFHTTANSWNNGNYLSTSNQVNGFDSTSNNFFLTGVQMELGSVATPFESRPHAQELALCQRYYENSYDDGVTPGTATVAGSWVTIVRSVYYVYEQNILFKSTKRVVPTVVGYSSTGASNKWRDASAPADRTFAVGSASTKKFQPFCSDATLVPGNEMQLHWTASAEL